MQGRVDFAFRANSVAWAGMCDPDARGCWFDSPEVGRFFLLRLLLFHLSPACDMVSSSYMNHTKPRIGVSNRELYLWMLGQKPRLRHTWNVSTYEPDWACQVPLGSYPAVESYSWFGYNSVVKLEFD